MGPGDSNLPNTGKHIFIEYQFPYNASNLEDQFKSTDSTNKFSYLRIIGLQSKKKVHGTPL